MTKKKTPFLWAGSKDRTYKRIKDYIPHFETYYEPFVGGGSIYFRLLARRGQFKAKLSDINQELITTYEVIRDNPIELCVGLPPIKDRQVWDTLLKSEPSNNIDQAIRFLYLNRNRFFGLGGWMNADRYCREQIIERIQFFSPRMQQTEFSSDGCFTYQYVNDDNFVFVDPPYPDTANESCYKIDKQDILQLNINYLHFLCKSKVNFFWIVKWTEAIADEFKKYDDVIVEEKEWIFRKPGKPPEKSKELYARRKAVPIDTLFY